MNTETIDKLVQDFTNLKNERDNYKKLYEDLHTNYWKKIDEYIHDMYIKAVENKTHELLSCDITNFTNLPRSGKYYMLKPIK